MSHTRTKELFAARTQSIKQLGGLEIRKIHKTQSNPALISDGRTGQEVVRNGKLRADAMLTWQLLHTYVAKLFQPEMQQRLFGANTRPQVAPILQKGDKDRVHYYASRTASAFSQVVGINTLQLAEELDVNALSEQYQLADPFGGQNTVSIDAAAYWMSRDCMTELPQVNGAQQLLSHIEDYWKELHSCNTHIPESAAQWRQRATPGKILQYRGTLHYASLRLIELGHQVVACIQKIIDTATQNSPEAVVWRMKPIQRVLLFMLHLYQTSVQEKILWWFGVEHGHLHPANAVAELPQKPVDEVTRVATRIIDFDDAGINVYALARNNELYSTIDPAAVCKEIKNEQLQIELRIKLILYLPLQHWDAEITALLREHASEVELNTILCFLSQRLPLENQPKERCAVASHFLFESEQKRFTERLKFPSFEYTLHTLRSQQSLFTDHPVLGMIAAYIESDAAQPPFENFTEEQEFIFISYLFQIGLQGSAKDRATDRKRIAVELLPPVFEWLLQLTKRSTEIRNHAQLCIESIFGLFETKFICLLVNLAQTGDTASARAVQGCVFYFFLHDFVKTEYLTIEQIRSQILYDIENTCLSDAFLNFLPVRDISCAEAAALYDNLLHGITVLQERFPRRTGIEQFKKNIQEYFAAELGASFVQRRKRAQVLLGNSATSSE